MAVASSPAGAVLAGPVFAIVFGSTHAQKYQHNHVSIQYDHTSCLFALRDSEIPDLALRSVHMHSEPSSVRPLYALRIT